MKPLEFLRRSARSLCSGLLFVILGCAQEAPERETALPVALPSMEALREAHQLADLAQSKAELRSALHAIEAAFQSHRSSPSGAGRLLAQDLADRAAKLCLVLDQKDAALRWLERGLSVTPAPSLVRANLLLTKADALVALGEENASREVLLQALQVNQALLEEELKDP